jgi:hypothetical protein
MVDVQLELRSALGFYNVRLQNLWPLAIRWIDFVVDSEI